MSTLVLLVGLIAVFAGLVMLFVAVGAVADDRRAVGRSLASIKAIQTTPGSDRPSVEQPFAERVIAPMLDRFLRIGRGLTGSDQASGIKRRLDIAGNPAGWDADLPDPARRRASDPGLRLAIGYGQPSRAGQFRRPEGLPADRGRGRTG